MGSILDYSEKKQKWWHLSCCTHESKPKRPYKYDPYVFEENSPQYHVCCGWVHVKKLATLFCLLKTLALAAFVARHMINGNSALSNITWFFVFISVSLSYILVIVGAHTKKYTFIIPYFTVCVLVILLLVMQLFMDFLETANRKDTLEYLSMGKNLALFLIIVFEIYTLSIVWKTFIYINDYEMHATLHSREKRQRLNSIFIKRCDGKEAYLPFQNHLIPIREESDDEMEVPAFDLSIISHRKETISS